jgi:hypothetical protein
VLTTVCLYIHIFFSEAGVPRDMTYFSGGEGLSTEKSLRNTGITHCKTPCVLCADGLHDRSTTHKTTAI